MLLSTHMTEHGEGELNVERGGRRGEGGLPLNKQGSQRQLFRIVERAAEPDTVLAQVAVETARQSAAMGLRWRTSTIRKSG